MNIPFDLSLQELIFIGFLVFISAAVQGVLGFGFAVIASLTPNKSDDRIVQMILDVVNFLGANFGKASNNK